MNNKKDLRVIKTKKAIEEAFVSLMFEKGFEAVTVRQILERALVNRSTFYAHYRDKYDLRDQIENELLQGLADRATENIIGMSSNGVVGRESLRTYLSLMLSFLEDNSKLFSYLLGPCGDLAFSSKLSDKAKEVWQMTGLIDRLKIPPNYILAGLSGMFSGILREWAMSSFENDRNDVLDSLEALVLNTLRGTIDWEGN